MELRPSGRGEEERGGVRGPSSWAGQGSPGSMATFGENRLKLPRVLHAERIALRQDGRD